jgi:hypothetical protein
MMARYSVAEVLYPSEALRSVSLHLLQYTHNTDEFTHTSHVRRIEQLLYF